MTDPQNLLPGLHEAMRLLKQNDLDYGPGRILDRIKELGGEPREFWVVRGVVSGRVYCATDNENQARATLIPGDNMDIIHCREVQDV